MSYGTRTVDGAPVRHNGGVERTTGRLLVAMPAMGDPNFERTVLWMLDHDDHGAIGVVLNRPSEVPVGMHLPQVAAAVEDPDVFFVGGPVSTEIVLGLTRDGAGVTSVDLDAVTSGGTAPPEPLRLFAGYAGWAPGQLEGELALDAWLVLDGSTDDVFTSRPESLWREVLGRQGGQVGRLAQFPDEPSLN